MVVVRFALVSWAMNTLTRQVFCLELGFSTLQSCRFSLKLPWPLSPPIFTHSCWVGMAPLCHVSPFGFLKRQKVRVPSCTCICGFYTCAYLSLCATTSATFRIRLGTNTKGTSLISSPPPSFEKKNGALSAWRLSPITSFANCLWLCSLARDIWNSLSHLLACTVH